MFFKCNHLHVIVTQNDISMLEKGNKDLMEKLKKSQAKLQAKKAESATLQQRFKVGHVTTDLKYEFQIF